MTKDDKDVQLDRRAFFTLGVKKVARTAVDLAQTRVVQRAKRYIRPPFALAELDFLIKCTRCSACIEACPQDIIFPLSARLGVEVVSTPALDLLAGACLLCEDWPCVRACEVEALQLPERSDDEGEQLAAPRLALAVIDPVHCLPFSGPECGVCGSACPIEGAIEWEMTKPKINEELCCGCAQCRAACITEPKAVLMRSVQIVEDPV
ncbi:MAG: 4Fe-4S binding protein [Hyphomicrobiaceae bacterium]|nr:4Fe-4S binding protein [Hyphomicrobiaceae bacterium]